MSAYKPMPYLSDSDSDRVIITLYVQTKSSRIMVAGLHDKAVKLKITAPPVEGKANAQITAFIAKLLKVSKSSVTILSGQQGRRKRIAIAGINPDEVRRIMAPLLE